MRLACEEPLTAGSRDVAQVESFSFPGLFGGEVHAGLALPQGNVGGNGAARVCQIGVCGLPFISSHWWSGDCEDGAGQNGDGNGVQHVGSGFQNL